MTSDAAPGPVPAPTPDPAPATPAPAPATPAPPAPAPAGGGTGVVALVVVAALAAAVGLQLRGRGEAPSDAAALLARANDRARVDGPEKAIPDFLAAVQADPEDGPANLALGRALLKSTRLEEALPHLRKAGERLAPEKRGDVDSLLAACLAGLGKTDEARRLLEATLTRAPDDVAALHDLAMLAQQTGELEESRRLFERYLARATDPLSVLVYAGVCDALGRGQDAIAPMTSLASVMPTNVRLRRDLLTRRLEHEGHAALAREAAATLADPKASAVDLYLAGRVLANDHRTVADARKAWARSREVDPALAWTTLALGVAAKKDGDLDAARALLEPLAKADPEFEEATFQLAKVDHAAGRLEPALAAFQALAAKRGPTASASRDWVQDCLLELGRKDEALAAARARAPKDAPPGHPARGVEARLLRRLGRFDEALALLDALERTAPDADKALPREQRALVHLEAARWTDAAAAYDAALAALPADERAPAGMLLWAGIAHDRAGDVDGARALWARGADGGGETYPEAQATWSCRRLLGRATEADLVGAARLGDATDLDDAWFVEGLARARAGDAEGARKAWEASQALSRADDFPARVTAAALAGR